VAWRKGAYVAAEGYLREAASLARNGADAVLEGRVWLSTAALRQAREQAGEQAAALERAVAVFAGCGAAYLEVRALSGLARVMAQQENAADAEAAWARVEHLYDAAGVPAADRLFGRDRP
jgi:hypothetical protein